MRKVRGLYDEFFHIPKDGKIREKVILARLAATVISMIAFLMATSITAYAYFSHSVTSAPLIIQSASFTPVIAIQDATQGIPVTVETVDRSATQKAALQPGNTYQITIEKAGTAGTGFCVITAEGCEVENYHTQQLGKDIHSNTSDQNILVFTMKVTNPTIVFFYAHWGTSSHYGYVGTPSQDTDRYIRNGEEVTLSIRGMGAAASDDDATTPPSEHKGEPQSTTITATTTTTTVAEGTTTSGTTLFATETTMETVPTPSSTSAETTTTGETTDETEPTAATTAEPATTVDTTVATVTTSQEEVTTTPQTTATTAAENG